ncbi:LuxR family transcriptional regulator [Methylobacterium sp. DCY52]
MSYYPLITNHAPMTSISQIAFDILEKIRSAQSVDDIQNELSINRSTFGYDAFVIGYLPRSSRQVLQDCTSISGWPREWEQRYQARGFIHVDPVLRHLKGVIDPFFWHEAPAGQAEGRIVMEEARVFGLRQGFCVPFHQHDGSEACISFGGARLELSPDERAALHMIAIYAASTAKAITQCQVQVEAGARTQGHLTAREVECLKWSAAGKTAWDISVILSISRRTVEHHLTSACTKLQAVGRTHCVAEAIRRKIIS